MKRTGKIVLASLGGAFLGAVLYAKGGDILNTLEQVARDITSCEGVSISTPTESYGQFYCKYKDDFVTEMKTLSPNLTTLRQP